MLQTKWLVISLKMFVIGKPKFTKPLEEKNDVDEGQTLTLSVNVQANPAPQIKWYITDFILFYKA